jgi:hypothetical protein
LARREGQGKEGKGEEAGESAQAGWASDDGRDGQRGPGPSSVRRAMRWCRLKEAWALNGYYLAV